MSPTYIFDPNKFLPIPEESDVNSMGNKRYLLVLDIKGERKGNENWLIILKNPSRAGIDKSSESDCTINRVGTYFYQNILEAKKLAVVNLFPVYLTDAGKLQDEKKEDLVDEKNKEVLIEQINKADKIILAWGAHPENCSIVFEEMKVFVNTLLIGKRVYQMKHPRWGVNAKRPLHGQVWGYHYQLMEISKY